MNVSTHKDPNINNKKFVIDWVFNTLKMPPFPANPTESVINNLDEKAPNYYKSKTFFTGVKWQKFQDWQKLSQETKIRVIQEWHKDPRIEGVSTLGGWNGSPWLCWIDFDKQQGQTKEDLNVIIDSWIGNYEILSQCLHFTTPNDGHRFLIALEKEPEDWGNLNNFTLDPKGTIQGQILTKNGGHTLLPPCLGINGNKYEWVKFVEYPPVIKNLKEIGIFKAKTSSKKRQKNYSDSDQESNENGSRKNERLLPFTQSIPLTAIIAVEHRKLIKSGVAEGGRDNTAIAIAKDLFGCANYLDDINQPYHEDPEDLIREFGANCDPPLESRDLDRIIRSARKKNPTPCLDQSKIHNCITAWGYKNNKIIDLAKYSAKKKRDAITTWLQNATDEIFGSTSWICVLNTFHRWKQTHYEKLDDGIVLKIIANWCDTHRSPIIEKGEVVDFAYRYAKANYPRQIMQWAKQLFFVPPSEINPPGVNLKNGTLLIKWEGATPVYQLEKHDSKHLYTYVSECAYNPLASSHDCDRLFQALEPDQLEVFLKVIAASLDLKTITKLKGRTIKSLILLGVGNNGKDAFREAISRLFGNVGITSCSLQDFKQYDAGRKFPLFPLGNNPRINWSSENTKYASLDNIQSLKEAISSDPIAIEKKGENETQIKLNTIFVFNVNEPPSIAAALEAIKSRYAVISFDKVFKNEPNLSQGELKADPRFKYDPQFMDKKILPALLNRLLKLLPVVASEGIDYEATEKAIEEIQCESNHLIRFCKDTGLHGCPNQNVSVKEIWSKLENWYEGNGTIEHYQQNGNQKKIWHDQARSNDKNVKSVNQVASRFLEMFPKSKRGRNKNGVILTCLSFDRKNDDEENAQKIEVIQEGQTTENKTAKLVDNPRDALIYSEDFVTVDDKRLNLFPIKKIDIQDWKPTRKLKDFKEIDKCYLDIETIGGLDPKEGRIISIGIGEEGNGTPLRVHCFSGRNEKKILIEALEYLSFLECEILIGHNIFMFDIPYICERCRVHDVRSPFTRGYKETRITSSSFYGKPLELTQWYWGKVQILDTFVAACIYDRSAAVLPNYNLKDVTMHLGFRDERRLELNHLEIEEKYKAGDITQIEEYLKYDLEDTKKLADYFLPTIWYQQLVVPNVKLQYLAIASPAFKWQKIAENFYNSKHNSEIKAQEKLRYDGALVSCNPGLYKSAYKLDVSSMYPSILLKYGLSSKKDPKKAILSVLSYLLSERLHLKKLYKQTKQQEYNQQQGALKILINGCYGFFGTGKYSYNDMGTAALVTAFGRRLLQLMCDVLIESGVTIIEIDTDGIICCGGDPNEMVFKVQSSLPEGINIDLDWMGKDCYVPKMKSYLLLEGKEVKRVGLFRKRNKSKLELDFPVEFIQKYLVDPEKAESYYQDIRKEIAEGKINTEALQITRKIYKSEKSLVAAGLGQVGEKITFYFGEDIKYSQKTGKQLKSQRKPVNQGPYYVEFYLEILDDMYQEIKGVITGSR